MGLISMAEEKVHRLVFWDWVLIKITIAFFGIIVGAYIADDVRKYILYFLVVFVILWVLSLYRFWRK